MMRRVREQQERNQAMGGGCWRTSEHGRTMQAELTRAMAALDLGEEGKDDE